MAAFLLLQDSAVRAMLYLRFYAPPITSAFESVCEEANLQRYVQSAALNLSHKFLDENLGSGQSYSLLTRALY